MVSSIFYSVLVVLSGDVIFGKILDIFWGGIQTTKTAVKNKFRYLKMSYLVRYSGLWPLLSCVGTLFSQKTRLLEYGFA